MNFLRPPARQPRIDDEDSNTSPNAHFDSVLGARLQRRSLLRGGVGGAATALFGSLTLAACGGSDDAQAATNPPVTPTTPTEKLLGFTPVAKSLADTVAVPAGYTASVVYALGDPLTSGTAAYKNDGTDTDYANRAGDHHDGMEWFGLSASGTALSTAADRGLLGINHEATTDEKLSSASSCTPTAAPPRTAAPGGRGRQGNSRSTASPSSR
jgi:secreted PhoX family phosphatase